MWSSKGSTLPTCHPPKSLDTPVNIALTLEEGVVCMLDNFSLPAQVCQSARADTLRLVGERLACLKTLSAAVETVGSRQQLLALFHMNIGRPSGVVGVARPKQGRTIGGERRQFASGLVGIGFVVAEALVDLGARAGWDILFLQAHLSQLTGRDC